MKKIIGLLAFVLIIIAGCTNGNGNDGGTHGNVNISGNNGEPPTDLPTAVLEKYEELRLEYDSIYGAFIFVCQKDGSIVYEVVGSTGFIGESYFYAEDGEYVGMYEWDDIIFPDDPQPPIDDYHEYECTELVSSVE